MILYAKDVCTVQSHYNMPHYNTVFSITQPCNGTQMIIFLYIYIVPTINYLIITRFSYNTIYFCGPQSMGVIEMVLPVLSTETVVYHTCKNLLSTETIENHNDQQPY